MPNQIKTLSLHRKHLRLYIDYKKDFIGADNHIAPFFIVACSSDSKEDTIPEEPQMTLADYQGVWEDIHNDTAFISISANGEVLYYKQNGVMGRGIGILADNTISITNEYTGSRDE